MRVFLTLLAAFVLPVMVRAQEPASAPALVAIEAPAKTVAKSVMVIPVRDGIDKPILYVLRRGLKEAIEKKVDVVVLDMKTPGGRLDVTFDIMEALEKFPGKRITFVNDQAISAGAFISAITDDIWFSPRGKIGAAAPVTGEGRDVDVTMKQKVVSFLKAEVRSVSEGKGYRGQVISAMIDADYELKIGDEVLKPKGELLTLTAKEAAKTYGNPPLPLLAAGIAKDVDDLLVQAYGAGNFTVQRLEVTWSEELASYLNALTPILMGLGLLAVFIEFKTPGFGFFGIAGGVLLGIVFFGHYIAGLSGHEPILIFIIGSILVVLELFLLPGTVVLALAGLVLMMGSLLWSMADVWPNQPVVISGDLLLAPAQNLLLALVIAIGLLVLIVRFLPHGWIWNRLAVGGAVSGAGVAPEVESELASVIGREGVAATALFPSGQVEIDGRRYEARIEVGFVEAGTPVRVLRRTDFGLIVEAKAS
jgi:membrane-bound serine protease (ClpP class)